MSVQMQKISDLATAVEVLTGNVELSDQVLGLDCDGCVIGVHSNSEPLIEHLSQYFSHLVCEPDKPVLCFTGDGSALMNIQELATLAELEANVNIILFDNNSLGLVRQQQRLFYGSRLHASEFGYCPDFAEIAEGFGIQAHRFDAWEASADGALVEAIQAPGPALISIALDNEAMVFHMVAPGGANTDMITQAPTLPLKV